MTVLDLYEEIKLETGQYVLDFIDYDVTTFKKILERKVFPEFGRYLPFVERQRIVVQKSPYIFQVRIPEWISELKPLDIYASSNILTQLNLVSRLTLDIAKPIFLWKYENPNLYTMYSSSCEAVCCFTIKLEDIPNVTDDWNIIDWDEHRKNDLIDLAAGHTLLAIGRARRSVQIEGLPLRLDWSELIADGEKLVSETMERIRRTDKWWLASG